MQKLLVIVGPTAVGKTALALHLSKVLDGELLSADSRQVYRGMDIVTGKDLPKDGTRIWLTDLVDPKEEFSVSQWREEAVRVMGEVRERGKLPIVVGGTGFYIKALLDGIETIDIPRNEKLRAALINKSVEELYELLASLDAVRTANMNQSDRKNSRRLIRAIEIARWKWEMRGKKLDGEVRNETKKFNFPFQNLASHFTHPTSILIIGLKAPWDVLRKRIEKRVRGLIDGGALDEVKKLVESGVPWSAQSMSGIGCQKFRDYFLGKLTLHEVKEKWAQGDFQYAKRQMTWFKKDKHIKWFDIATPSWEKKVEKLVQNWYNHK